MFTRIHLLLEAGIASENNLIRRTTLVLAMPPVGVVCIGINGIETACEWVKDIAVELDGMKGNVLKIW